MSSVQSDASPEGMPAVPDSELIRKPGVDIAVVEPGSVTGLLRNVDVIRDAMNRAMERGVHYGEIRNEQGVVVTPPTLMKAGAEKLCVLFHLRPHYEELASVHRDNLIAYRFRCVLTYFPESVEIGEGVGSCNSREKKYRRSDPWDIDNTIVKMACKRALVSAILASTAASDIFKEGPGKTRGELSAILNGRAADLDTQMPREDGQLWQDWTRTRAGELWGYESRAECTDEELEQLINELDREAFGARAA